MATITITRQQLVANEACKDGLKAWDKHFGASVTFDPKSVKFWTWVVKSELWRHIGWFCDVFDITCNLDGADLREANLYGANLYGANLTGADLREANLTGADLTGAILTEADLTGAILTEADLRRANLHRANLTEADLRGAILPINWREQVSAY